MDIPGPPTVARPRSGYVGGQEDMIIDIAIRLAAERSPG
jgi:DmpG-like communication domain